MSRAYRPGRRSEPSTATRNQILGVVRALLAEGTFHQTTVEEVARRAGVARATLYQHFSSRLGLVDAMCETFDANPALIRLRTAVTAEDGVRGLDLSIENVSKFWESEETILQQLYGVAAVDEAAQDLVRRQTEDRRNEMTRLVASMRAAKIFPAGVTDETALTYLLMLTSFETYEELRRRVGMTEKKVIEFLKRTARALLVRA